MKDSFECVRCGTIYKRPKDMFCVFCEREGLKKTSKIKLVRCNLLATSEGGENAKQC